MPEANVHDRSSVERLYPREAFERDAGENADAKATVHHGLVIVAAADTDGRFGAERASRHVGEGDPEGDTVFLAPFLARSDAPLGTSDAPPSDAAIKESKDKDYRAFVDRIIETARTARFKPAVGLGEERLRGFHGG